MSFRKQKRTLRILEPCFLLSVSHSAHSHRRFWIPIIAASVYFVCIFYRTCVCKQDLVALFALEIFVKCIIIIIIIIITTTSVIIITGSKITVLVQLHILFHALGRSHFWCLFAHQSCEMGKCTALKNIFTYLLSTVVATFNKLGLLGY